VKDQLEQLVAHCKAALELGMHRNTLVRVIRELKIDFEHCRPGYQKPVRAERYRSPQALREEMLQQSIGRQRRGATA
jgi:transcriptional accessory protein Tex/SPT6